jgi:CSLREA domain-containing protein
MQNQRSNMTRTTLRHTPLCAVVLLVAAFSATHQVSAATILVSTTQDAAPGTAVAGCSLREAVNAINNQANGSGCTNTGSPYGTSDMIRFNPGVNAITLSATINFATPVALSIQRPMLIMGNGQTVTRISGNGTPQTLFQNSSSNFTIQDLHIRVARTGVLNLAGARAILFQMRLSEFSRRAVVNNGRMQITLVRINNNPGGGVSNGNLVSVTALGIPDVGCMIDNSCDDEREPAQRPAQLVIDRSVIAANGPVACAGISNGGGPVQGGLGGQAQSIDGDLLLRRSRVVGNNGGDNKGGGICNRSVAEITQSEISSNRAQQGGGIALVSPPLFPAVVNPRVFTIIKNSTISSNSASIRGGGMLVEAGTGPLTIESSTITMNSAQGTGFQDGGGLAGSVSPVVFRASVLVDNRSNAMGAGLQNCANLQLQGNFNFFPVVNNATCTLTGQNNISIGNAFLAGLAIDQSGRRSHMPALNSPLVDAIPVVAVNQAICSGFDQSERSRPRDGNNIPPIACDIGAIERP